MGETMKVALTFTAIDAASGYIAGLERRIDSLGEAGKKMRTEYDAMRSHFTEGLKGFGMAYTSMQFMKPGIAAASAMEASGISMKNSLYESGKSTELMAAQYKSMRSMALFLSEHSPFAAPDILHAEKLLKDSGFTPGEIAGSGGLAASVAGMSQLSGQSMESVREMAEIFNQQFGSGAAGIGAGFDWISQSGMEDKLPDLATGLASMGTRAAAMKIPVKDAISTISMLEHVARRSGGAIGAFLKSTRPDATSSQAVRMRDTGLNFYDAKGGFIGMEATQKLLKQKFGGVQGDRIKMLESIFGEGSIAAEGLIKAENLAEINAQNERALKLQEKVKNLNQGLASSYEQMARSGTNLMGSLFTPVTGLLSATARGGKNVFGWLGAAAENHPKVSAGLVGAGGAAVAGMTAYGLFHMAKSIGNLTSLSGMLANTAVGVAAGKALESTAGIMPVFVTNMPGSGGGGAFNTGAEKILSSTVGTGAGAAATGGILATGGASMLGIIGGLSLLFGGAAYSGIKTGNYIGEHASRIDYDDMKGAEGFTVSEKTAPKVTINLNVDKDGRVTAKTDLGTDLQLNRGNFSYGF